jgi:S1-C subfamily serine protease
MAYARLLALGAGLLALVAPSWATAQSPLPDLVGRVRGGVVAVGTYSQTRSPPFRFLGTGFGVGDGRLVATNLHVVPALLGGEKETLAVAIPKAGLAGQVRTAKVQASDDDHDLAVLRIEGEPILTLPLSSAGLIPEGQEVALIGYPIGTVLGLFPAVHRGIVAAVSPIVLPQPTARTLDARVLRRMRSEPFPVYQLDATVYPGNSGSPLLDPRTGEVVGIINMTFVKGSRESALTNPSGISFAIPVTHLEALVRK